VEVDWKDIFMYCGYAANGILLVSAAVMLVIRYLKKRNAGLRTVERPGGTIYTDEKRRLEFVSYPGKAPEYRVKSDALGYTYENTRKPVRPAYESAWRVQLSSQKGCPMKCALCDCPAFGFYGNASAEDLASQIDTIVSGRAGTHTERFEADFTRMGEPTLNPEFPQIIDDTLRLRDTYYPSAKVSVLSNATRVHLPEVFAALRKVDNPIMKIDAPTNELAAKINNPAPGYDVARVIEALKQFRGNFVLQTCMLRSPDFDSASPEVVKPLMDIVRLLKPREWMVYTIDRPTPMQGLVKFSPQEMKALVQPIIDQGFKVQIKGAVEDN
jgi:wyosine [tRNA(Phe)-imidazoG37] synthetase (radical SAM superfamily)